FLGGIKISPLSMTIVPVALSSLGQVSTKPLGQWSQRPGSSTKPYSLIAGYSPIGQYKSVPAADTIRIDFAFSICLAALVTRSLSSGVGTVRTKISGGSTANRILVPAFKILPCSGENSNVIKSNTISLDFNISI